MKEISSMTFPAVAFQLRVSERESTRVNASPFSFLLFSFDLHVKNDNGTEKEKNRRVKHTECYTYECIDIKNGMLKVPFVCMQHACAIL